MIRVETKDTLKRPWVARLNGIEQHTDRDGTTRMRFEREFGVGVRVVPAGSQESRRFYDIDIYGSGVFELRVPGKLSDFYVAHEGRVKKVANPFPDDWGEYMQENGTDYEATWWDIWTCLRRRYESFSGKRDNAVRVPQANSLTDAELDEFIKEEK